MIRFDSIEQKEFITQALAQISVPVTHAREAADVYEAVQKARVEPEVAKADGDAR